jgi:hypothetical protein
MGAGSMGREAAGDSVPASVRLSVWLTHLAAVLLLARAVAWGAERGGRYAAPVLIGLVTVSAFSLAGASLTLRSRQGYLLLFVLGGAPFLHGLIAGVLLPLWNVLAARPAGVAVSPAYYASVLAATLGLGCLYGSLLRREVRAYVWRKRGGSKG